MVVNKNNNKHKIILYGNKSNRKHLNILFILNRYQNLFSKILDFIFFKKKKKLNCLQASFFLFYKRTKVILCILDGNNKNKLFYMESKAEVMMLTLKERERKEVK